MQGKLWGSLSGCCVVSRQTCWPSGLVTRLLVRWFCCLEVSWFGGFCHCFMAAPASIVAVAPSSCGTCGLTFGWWLCCLRKLFSICKHWVLTRTCCCPGCGCAPWLSAAVGHGAFLSRGGQPALCDSGSRACHQQPLVLFDLLQLRVGQWGPRPPSPPWALCACAPGDVAYVGVHCAVAMLLLTTPVCAPE
jgi:hypothetical protein